MNQTRKRRQRREPNAEPRPPVLVVSCPQCGGSVRDADLGERTKCQYCGTDLHLPTVDFTPDSPPSEARRPTAAVVELEPEQQAAGRSQHQPLLLAMAVLVLLGALAVIMFASSSSSPQPSTVSPAPQSARDKELEGTMAGANCTLDCTKPCLEISDPTAVLMCLDNCEHKCKFVGKGTPGECRSRCSSTCGGAPDAASRAACESGCMQGCPPG